MKTLRIRIENLEQVRESVLEAVSDDRPEKEAGLSFTSYEVMHRILSPKRLAIVSAMSGKKAMSIREIARKLGRDFKAVHGDVTALINAGVVDRGKEGVVFPFDAIHVEFDIQAAA